MKYLNLVIKKYLINLEKKNKISSKLNITSLVKHLIKLLEKKDFFLPIEKKTVNVT